MAQTQINCKIGFQTDKTGLQELQTQLNRIQMAAQANNVGDKINQSLQQAGRTAQQLSNILSQSTNMDLGTVNITKFSQGLKQAKLSVQQLKTDLSAAGTAGATAFNTLSNNILNTKMQLQQSSVVLDKLANTMANTVRWSITSSLLNAVTSSISKAVDYTEDLNTSLNDIRIVTGKSAENMEVFAQQANKAARALSASTLDYSEASLIYYQQGLSDREAQARAATTIKAANVTGQSASEVSELLTSVWNGYKVTAEEAELYIDKLAAVAASTAADLEELSVGMSKVASAANSMGVDIDQLNAQLATVVSVTRQAPETVGTAFKTIYARISDLQVDGTDEFGVSLGEVSGTLEQVGIEILDVNGDLRDMGTVMTEVGEKWNQWTEAQQQAIAISMAGKRQYNNLIALFENWDMYSEALETSANSMGTLQKQQEIYAESTAAKLKELKGAAEDLYSSILFDDEKNFGIDALTNLVETFDKFIDSFGGGIKSITAFGTIIAGVFHKQIGGAIAKGITNIKSYRSNLINLQTQKEFAQAGMVKAEVTGQQDLAYQMSSAQAEAQMPIAQRIAQMGPGLDAETYNALIEKQKQIGELAAQEVEVRVRAKTTLQEELSQLGLTQDQQAKILQLAEAQTAEQNEENQALQAELAIEKQLAAVEERSAKLNKMPTGKRVSRKSQATYLSDNFQDILNIDDQAILNNIKAGSGDRPKYAEQIAQIEKKISQELEKQAGRLKQSNHLLSKYSKEVQKAENIHDSMNIGLAQMNETMDEISATSKITNAISGITTAMSSLSMAWMQMQSLGSIWSENVSLSDKLTQTFMTLSFTVPMLITGIRALGEAFGKSSIGLDVFTTKVALNNALKGTNIGLTKKMTAEEMKNVIADKVAASGEENKIIAQKLSNASVAEAIAMLQALTPEQLEAIGLDAAHIKVLIAKKKAQDAANSSMLMSPIGWMIGGIMALIAVITIVTNLQKKAQEEREEAAKKAVEAAEKAVEAAEKEREAVEELANAYEKLADSYKNNDLSLESLRASTHALLLEYGDIDLAIKALSADYEGLNKLIRESEIRAQQEVFEAKKEEEETEFKKAKIIAEKGVGDASVATVSTYRNNKIAIASIKQIAQAINDTGIIEINPDQIQYNEYARDGWWDKTYSNVIQFSEEQIRDILLADENAYNDFINAVRSESGYGGEAVTFFEQLKENSEDWLSALEASIEAQKELIGLRTYEGTEVTDVDSYIAEVEDLKQAYLDEELTADPEEAKKWALSYLAGFEDLTALGYEAAIEMEIATHIQNKDLLDWLKNQDTSTKTITLSLGTGLDTISSNYIQAYADLVAAQNRQSLQPLITDIINQVNEGNEVSDEDWNSLLSFLTDEQKKEVEGKTGRELSAILNRIAVESASAAVEDASGNLVTKYEEAYEEEQSKYTTLLSGNVDFDEDLINRYRNLIGDTEAKLTSNQDLLEFNEILQTKLNDAIVDVQKNEKLSEEERRKQIAEINNILKLFGTNEFFEQALNYFSDDGSSFELGESIDIPTLLFAQSFNQGKGKGQGTTEAKLEIDVDTTNLDLAKSTTLELTSALGYYKNALDVVEDGLIVSQENVEIIATNIPELLEGAMDLGNGTIQLNQDVYNDFLTNAKSYIGTIDTLIKDYAEKMKTAYAAGDAALGAQYATLIATLSGWKSYAENADKAVDPVKKLYNELDHIEKKIDILSRKTDRLTSSLEKMSGATFKANYQSVNSELERQISLYRQLEKEYEKEYRRQQVNLLGYGFTFSSEGIIQNYSDILNNLGEEDQKKAEEMIDAYYEAFQGFYDAQDSQIEIMNEQIENELKAFNIDIEITTNIDEVRDAILELNKILLDEDDIAGLTGANIDALSGKYKILNEQSLQVEEIRKEIEKIYDEQDSVYAYVDPATGQRVNDLSAAYEALKENTDQMVDTLGSIKDISQEIEESYINLLDQAQEQFDAYINSLEQLDDFLNHRISVVELLQGEDAYDTLGNIYAQQAANYREQRLSFEEQMRFYETKMAETKNTNDEAYKDALEKWQEAASGWQNIVEAAIEVAQQKYTNAIKAIFKDLENELTQGRGFDTIAEEWELIKANSEDYLDTVNRAYETEKLSLKYRQAIDQTDNVKAQAKLQKAMESELALLEEKDKLSQYDIERADLKYQITMKQLALEDQMQAKTKMRLTRDATGGYSYKFVADENATEDLRSELLDLENQLYNLDKDKYEENLDEVYELYQEFAEKIQEVLSDTSLSEEEKLTRIFNLRNSYQSRLIAKAQENTIIQQNLIDSVGRTMDDLMSTLGKDIETILNESIPGLTSGMQGMAQSLLTEGGFYTILDDAFVKLDKAANDFSTELKELKLDTTYNNIATNIANIIEATDPMLTAINDQFTALEPLLKRVQGIETAWAGALKNAQDLAKLSYSDYEGGIGNEAPGAGGGTTLNNPTGINVQSRWTTENYSQIDKELIDKYGVVSQEEFNKNRTGGLSGEAIDIAAETESNQYQSYQGYLDAKFKEAFGYSPQGAIWDNTIGEDFWYNGVKWTHSSAGTHPTFDAMQETDKTIFLSETLDLLIPRQQKYASVAFSKTGAAYPFSNSIFGNSVFTQDENDRAIYYNQHDKYIKAKILNDGDKGFVHGAEFYLPVSGITVERAGQKYGPKTDPYDLNSLPVFQFDTGGYTGAWGTSDGRVALLHEKELVLNKEDTANILSTVSIVRDIVSALSTSMNIQIADKMSRVLSASDFESAETAPMEQNVHIEAHFPNVNNSKEIEEAFDNLVLRATQAALKNPNR